MFIRVAYEAVSNWSKGFISFVLIFAASAQADVPAGGYVPNENTAIKIAEAILVPIFGERVLAERPFVASLKEGVWLVRGHIPKGQEGGVAEVRLSKQDAKILSVLHGK